MLAKQQNHHRSDIFNNNKRQRQQQAIKIHAEKVLLKAFKSHSLFPLTPHPRIVRIVRSTLSTLSCAHINYHIFAVSRPDGCAFIGILLMLQILLVSLYFAAW